MKRWLVTSVVAAVALFAAPNALAIDISIGDSGTFEGNSGTSVAGFAVTLSAAAPPGGLDVTYATSDGTATDADNDYEPVAATTLTIAEGNTMGLIQVTINGDTAIEPNETFTVTLSNPEPGDAITDATATGTIANDDYWPACGIVTQECYSTFQVDLDGPGAGGFAAPPAGIVLRVSELAAVQVQVLYDDGNPATTDYDLVAGAAPLTPDSVIRIVLNLGTNDPIGFVATGAIQTYSHTLDGTTGNTLSVDMTPSDSSWTFGACMVGNCGDNTTAASVDYEGLAIGASFGWQAPGGLTPEELTEFNAMKEPFRGTWVSTDAQAFSFPTFNPMTNAFEVEVASPHFKVGGSTLNVGFFKAFLTNDFLEVAFGITDPSSVTATSLTVKQTESGTTTTVNASVSTTTGGVIVELPTISYSAPKFAIAKAAAAPAGGGSSDEQSPASPPATPATPAAPAQPAGPLAPKAGVPLVTGDADDDIVGGDGDFVVEAGNGNNYVVLGNGNNRVLSGSGDDRIFIGSGTSRVETGDGRDRIVVGGGSSFILAGGGADVVRSSSGADRVAGGGGNDVLLLGHGADRGYGGEGADYLAGGAGADRLDGGPGRDRLVGGSGDDVLDLRDGAAGDRVSCGAGRDIVFADRGDRVGGDCEVVRLS